MKALSKKGLALGDLQSVVMSLVLIGTFMAVGIWIMSDLQEATFEGTAQTAVAVTLLNNTQTALPHTYVRSVDAVYNSTHTLLAGNYTFTEPNLLTLVLDIDNDDTDGDWTVNYTVYDDAGYTAAANATSGISNLASWLPVVAILLAAGLVIGVLINWFGNRVI